MGEPTVISLICDMLVIECVVIRLQSYANSRGLPNQKVKIKLAVLRCMSSIGGLGQPMAYPLLRLPRAECRFGFHPAFLGRDENKSAGTIRATPSRLQTVSCPPQYGFATHGQSSWRTCGNLRVYGVSGHSRCKSVTLFAILPCFTAFLSVQSAITKSVPKIRKHGKIIQAAKICKETKISP